MVFQATLPKWVKVSEVSERLEHQIWPGDLSTVAVYSTMAAQSGMTGLYRCVQNELFYQTH